MNRFLLAAATAAAVVLSPAAGAQTVLKMQSSSAAGSFSLKYMQEVWAPKLEQMTYGNLKIDIRPSKSVVPHRETPQAVSAGILQGDLNAVAYFAGRDPVFGIMGDLIAGYDTPAQKQMFFRFGGGVEIHAEGLRQALSAGKIKVVGAGPFAKEAFVSTIADQDRGRPQGPEAAFAGGHGCRGVPPRRLRPDLHSRSPSCTPRSRRRWWMRLTPAPTPTTHSLGFNKIAKYPLYPGHSLHGGHSVRRSTRTVWEKIGPHGAGGARDLVLRRVDGPHPRHRSSKTASWSRWTSAGKGNVRASRSSTGRTEERDEVPCKLAQGAWEDISKQSPIWPRKPTTRTSTFMQTDGSAVTGRLCLLRVLDRRS